MTKQSNILGWLAVVLAVATLVLICVDDTRAALGCSLIVGLLITLSSIAKQHETERRK